jgi:hypothetical protein
MTDETNTTSTEVTTTTENKAVAPVSGRLANLLAKEQEARPKTVAELVGDSFAEGETGFSDEYFETAKNFMEKTGVLQSYLEATGADVAGNITEWQPTLVGMNSGKGKQATELRHLPLPCLYNYNSKEQLVTEGAFFYPVFIHGEEILKDESGMNIEDRMTVPYNSAQDAKTPGYDYQNVVYLLDRGLTTVYKLSVKSAGHKYVTNILRNYMYPNYKRGVMFNPTALKSWMTMDIVEHTSKSGYKNPYARLTASTEAITSDEAKLINIFQRKMYDDFTKVLERAREEQADAAETQQLVDDNTTIDDSGDNFTTL